MEEGWDRAITRNPELGYHTIASEVLALANASEERNEDLDVIAKILDIWIDIDGKSWDGKRDRYRARVMLRAGDGLQRSTSQEDINAETLKKIMAAAETADNPWIVGKLCDLVWRCRKHMTGVALPRATAARERAIEAWISISGEGENADLDHCWARAATLTREKGSERAEKLVRQRLTEVLTTAVATPTGKEMPRLQVGAAEKALRRCRMSQQERMEIARLLSTVSDRYLEEGNHNWTQGTREEAIEWAVKAGHNGWANEERWKWGEEEIRWAEQEHGGENETPWVLMTFYEKAINEMARGVGQGEGEEKARRLNHLENLRRKHQGYADRASEGLTTIESAKIDITTHVRAAQAAVKGKSFNEAALIVARSGRPKAEEDYERSAEKAYTGSILQHESAVVMNEHGQRIQHEKAKHSLSRLAMEQFTMETQFEVQGRILPMLQTIREEHGRVTPLPWYEQLCEKSLWVPEDHTVSWSEGLQAGMERRWKDAMHLLLPRVESCLRHLAREAGILRASQLGGRHEKAWNLGELLEPERSASLISREWRTALDSTIAGSTGWNLRNDHCHGLIADDGYDNRISVYTWWLLFHMTVEGARHGGRPPLGSEEPGSKRVDQHMA